MKLRVIWVGRTKNPNLARVAEDFAGRIRHFIGMDILEMKEPRIADDARRIEAEGAKILAALDRSDFVVALDAGGRSYTSESFAGFFGTHMSQNPRDIVFVVGGPAGLDERIKSRADIMWSLSKLTFSHDLARTVLLEQIYRALTLIRNLPYAR